MFKYVSKPCQFKICIFFQLRGLPNHFTGDSLNNLRRPNTPNQLCWILILTHLRIFPLLLLHFNRILINWCGIQEKWQLWPFPSWWQGFGRYLWTVKWNAAYGPPLLAMDSSHRSVKSSGWGGGSQKLWWEGLNHCHSWHLEVPFGCLWGKQPSPLLQTATPRLSRLFQSPARNTK